MVAMSQHLLFFLCVVVLPLRSFSQPQNIETFFPSDELAPVPPPRIPPSPSDRSKITKAVLITAAVTVFFAATFFFFLQMYLIASRRRRGNRVGAENTLPPLPLPPPATVDSTLAREGFTRFEGNLKGLILDENGLDVLYWRNLQRRSGSFRKKEIIAGEDSGSQEKEVVTEIPLLRGRSSTSHSVIHNEVSFEIPPPPPSIPVNKSAPPPLPPPPPKKGTSPSPSPPPPPPLKKAAALSSSALKPPPAPPRGSSGGESSRGQVKLKPLHWDKVNTDSDHSMVWDKIDLGSFSVDGDLMEALFGYVAVGNNKSPENIKPTSPRHQIFILDPRKSQNSAIVLKSLGVTREELVEALIEGQDLAEETLERLARIAPTREEQTAILGFEGDVDKLAEAELFLFHLLKAVPTAFMRVNAFMLKGNYYPEIAHHSKCLQTLELACKELRSRGLFVKLLEAILKAGNRMNAGTARGNAEAFNLTALLKLADVKSVDGKTTLLHFVVEEVVRSEGKRCVLHRRSNSISSNNPQAMTKEEQEKEFLKLGLPIVGGLSSEFSNVKKAASVDYETVVATCSALEVRAKDARKVIAECEEGRFVNKMVAFLDSVEEEVKMAREEERRVMELVKRTTEYYQAGGSVKGKSPLHLFGIVRDFLDMVDKVCLDVMRSLQRRNIVGSGSHSRQRNGVKFPVLPPNFMSDRSRSDSGESDSDM